MSQAFFDSPESFFGTEVAPIVDGKGNSALEDEFQAGNTMKIVCDGDIKLTLQVRMCREGVVKAVEIPQTHLHQFLCNLLFS